jgi:hypothetical protein
MTAQISDSFLYRGQEYAIAGISEGELFEPKLFGMTPTHTSTACWRGYQARYALDGPHLVLDRLYVNLMKPDTQYEREPGPPLNGVTPVDGHAELEALGDDDERMQFHFRNTRTWFNNNYVGLRHRLDYTGGILLASGFISELYVHMGFHPAWKFEKVVELIFEAGELRQEHDRSRAMAELRQMYLDSPTALAPGPKSTDDDIRKFVERAFDRRY